MASKLLSICLLSINTVADEFDSPFYEWVHRRGLRHPVDTQEMAKYPSTCKEHNFICRAKTTKSGQCLPPTETKSCMIFFKATDCKFCIDSFPDGLYLAGEVIDGWCVFGWNEVEKTEDFEVLRPKCDSGELTWLKEDEELEFGAEKIVRVQNNSVPNDFIGICEFEQQNGWSRGNACQWRRPTIGAHRKVPKLVSVCFWWHISRTFISIKSISIRW